MLYKNIFEVSFGFSNSRRRALQVGTLGFNGPAETSPPDLTQAAVTSRISCTRCHCPGGGSNQRGPCGRAGTPHFPSGYRKTDPMGHFRFHFCEAQITQFLCSRSVSTTNASDSLRCLLSPGSASPPPCPGRCPLATGWRQQGTQTFPRYGYVRHEKPPWCDVWGVRREKADLRFSLLLSEISQAVRDKYHMISPLTGI